jgi:hypothetical protein
MHDSGFAINEKLIEKWATCIDVDKPGLRPITDMNRRNVLAHVLENTSILAQVERETKLRDFGYDARLFEKFIAESVPTNNFGSGQIQYLDPVLIGMLRRSVPNLMAYDVCGVQPMTGPTGAVFALRALYSNNAGNETFYNEVDTAHTTNSAGANTLGDKHVGGYPGNSTSGTANLAEAGIYNYADGMATADLEALGSNSTTQWAEMSFTIDKLTVTAKGRAVKGLYSIEFAQDLRAVHGMDADKTLSDIMTTELTAEINREIIRTINVTAVRGAASGTTTVGRFDLDTDSNGRWLGEKLKGLAFFIDLEANQVAKETRRGKANIIICSSNVATALQNAGALDYTPAIDNSGMQIDDTGNTFAGVAFKRYRVYIDPYATGNYLTLGYKGAGPMDAGMYYCPYVPLHRLTATDPNTLQPVVGYKARYAVAQNPFSKGIINGAVGGMATTLVKDSNVYYRRILIDNLL